MSDCMYNINGDAIILIFCRVAAIDAVQWATATVVQSTVSLPADDVDRADFDERASPAAAGLRRVLERCDAS